MLKESLWRQYQFELNTTRTDAKSVHDDLPRKQESMLMRAYWRFLIDKFNNEAE